jgi:membrane-bound lytic murein transglycosylase D
MPIADDERTVFIPQGARAHARTAPVEIHYPGADGTLQHKEFTHAVVVGRGEDCAIRITNPLVSRHHVEIFPQADGWWVRDLQSGNGTLVNGRAIERLPLAGTITFELGGQGPRIRVVAPPPSPASADDQPSSLKRISDHYFGGAPAGSAGEHTMLIRQAYKQIKRRQSRVYVAFIGVAFVSLLLVGGVALVQYVQLQKMRTLANDIFYGMKELELYVANLEADLQGDLEETRRMKRRQEIAEARRKLAAMREDYETYVRELRASRLITPNSKELLILHMARVFGETEVDVPKDFANEVERYIKKWQSSDRLESAIRRLRENDYLPTIYDALFSQGLPPQFLYLALQESNFQPRIVGPPTRYGHAKGMWQFIPDTAQRYGLRLGPLKDTGSYDPADDRHDFRRSTYAAARYLKDIYRTDAQASGLLVMASYNWGEGNIIKRIRMMPNNPRGNYSPPLAEPLWHCAAF